ncbi:MAG: hypothetical protein V3V99_03555 [candidate division Zixibacteria bacterium]
MRTHLRYFPVCIGVALLLILCSMLIGCSNNAETQTEDAKSIRIVKLHYENTSGENGFTTFFYDDNGLMYGARWELLDGNRHSDDYHILNKRGQIIRKYREFSDTLTSDNWYEYDEGGNLTGEIFERSDGVTGTTQYIYDENKRRIKADCNGLKGWFFGDIDYRHDDKGRVISADITRDGENIGTIAYTYNQYDSLETKIWKFGDDWSQTFKYEYEEYQMPEKINYASANVFIAHPEKYRVKIENYDYNNEQGGPSHYEYETGGRLVKKTFVRSDGLKTETTFEYDDNGILLKSYRAYHDGKTGTFEYTYNGNRKLVERLFERSDGFEGSEHYEYDGKGLLTKANYKNFDTWLSGVITFTHDDQGDLKTGLFKGENDFDADIEFNCDDNGNVIKIHWKFTFDQTQTYLFEYEKI